MVVLIPVYNDWESLSLLLGELASAVDGAVAESVTPVVVDDGSTVPATEAQRARLAKARVVRLTRNVGHQKAIAVGLSYVADRLPCDAVVVMDADGEDRPGDIRRLADALRASPGRIVFARRTRRHEGPAFQLFYALYRMAFYLLTGKAIGFGNFCVVPADALRRVVSLSEIWNHFSGGVIRSNTPYATVPIERGRRIAGASRMNFTALVMHGLSAISVHVDTVSVRLLVVSTLFILIGGIGALAVIGVRLFTNLAIPGWASTVVIGFSIIFMQAFLVSLFLAFIVLSYRTQRLFIPAAHYRDYVASVDEAD